MIGDWEDPDINDDEAERRRVLEMAVFDRLDVDPAEFNDLADNHEAVVEVLVQAGPASRPVS